MLRPDEEQINTTGINGNGKNRLKKLWSMNIFLWLFFKISALVPYVQVEEANFQYPQLEYIPEVEEFVDMSPDDQEPIGRSNLGLNSLLNSLMADLRQDINGCYSSSRGS